MEDVHLWMIDQHLGRRSVSDFQRGVLALRKREILSERKARAAAPATAPESAAATPEPAAPEALASLPPPEPLSSREAIAKAARLSSSQVVMIEKIQKQAAPELVAAVKSGTISINAAAAVATLPAQEQVAAVAAGKDELKQAAKRVRELNKRKPREETPGDEKEGGDTAAATAGSSADTDELHSLRAKVAELTAENTELRRQVAQLQAALPAGSAPF
jgi:polyhydroxyalkanoate synthesis regulator phasin